MSGGLNLLPKHTIWGRLSAFDQLVPPHLLFWHMLWVSWAQGLLVLEPQYLLRQPAIYPRLLGVTRPLWVINARAYPHSLAAIIYPPPSTLRSTFTMDCSNKLATPPSVAPNNSFMLCSIHNLHCGCKYLRVWVNTCWLYLKQWIHYLIATQ